MKKIVREDKQKKNHTTDHLENPSNLPACFPFLVRFLSLYCHELLSSAGVKTGFQLVPHVTPV